MTTKDFNQYCEQEAAEDYTLQHGSAPYSEEELILWYAEENNLITSEEQISTLFDQMVDEMPPLLYRDKPAFREAFNNFMDVMQKNGQLHESQANEYSYLPD